MDRRVLALKPGDRIVCPNSGRPETVTGVTRQPDRRFTVHTDQHTHPNLYGTRRVALALEGET